MLLRYTPNIMMPLLMLAYAALLYDIATRQPRHDAGVVYVVDAAAANICR